MDNSLVPSVKSPEQIIWQDRIKIGHQLFPEEKDINLLIKKVEQRFGLEAVEIRRRRMRHKGPSFKIKCVKEGCNGEMWPQPPSLMEADKGVQIKFICVKCKHQIVSNIHPKEWLKKGNSIKPEELKEMVKPALPFPQKIKNFKNVVSGPLVIPNVYEERKEICGIKQPKEKQCIYLKTKVFGKLYWCGACGCGYNPVAELHIKLRFARLECPKIPSAFLPINEETEQHLLKKV